ncbi:MAG: hypothetical protein ABSA92_05770 [Candidatus Bathyarchaeia archaeon]
MRDLNASITRYQDKKKKKTKNIEGPQPKVKRISEIVRDLGDIRKTLSS